jgi:threonine dehydrogenase-like Zn-dependent dehydrogenase
LATFAVDSFSPCADGYPNHCENLDEIGFNVNGAFAQYIVLPARVLWSLEPLADLYKGDDLFLAGSLVEPTSYSLLIPQLDTEYETLYRSFYPRCTI